MTYDAKPGDEVIEILYGGGVGARLKLGRRLKNGNWRIDGLDGQFRMPSSREPGSAYFRKAGPRYSHSVYHLATPTMERQLAEAEERRANQRIIGAEIDRLKGLLSTGGDVDIEAEKIKARQS